MEIEPFKINGLAAITRAAGVSVNRDGLSISFDPAATADQVKKFALTCVEWVHQMAQLRSVGKLWLAKAVLEIAARTESTPEEALDSMEIPPIHGWSSENITKYVRAVQCLGEDAFIDNLTDGQVMQVAMFRAPDVPDKAMEFTDRRRQIMQQAADENHTTKWITARMKELQAEFGMIPKGGRTKEDCSSMYARLMFIKEHADNDWYITHGIDRADVSAWLVHYEMELQTSDILPYTIEEVEIPHFLKPTTEPFE